MYPIFLKFIVQLVVMQPRFPEWQGGHGGWKSGEEANIHYSLWSFPSLTGMVGSPVNEEGKFLEVTAPPVFSSYNLPLNGGFRYSLQLPEGEHDKVRYRIHYAASFAYLRCSACSFDLSAPKLTSTFTGNSTHLSRFYLNTPSSVRYLPSSPLLQGTY